VAWWNAICRWTGNVSYVTTTVTPVGRLLKLGVQAEPNSHSSPLTKLFGFGYVFDNFLPVEIGTLLMEIGAGSA